MPVHRPHAQRDRDRLDVALQQEAQPARLGVRREQERARRATSAGDHRGRRAAVPPTGRRAGPRRPAPPGPTARDTSSHSAGAAAPNGASSAVTSTGSGFHAIVPSEPSAPARSSRPQISHTHGS